MFKGGWLINLTGKTSSNSPFSVVFPKMICRKDDSGKGRSVCSWRSNVFNRKRMKDLINRDERNHKENWSEPDLVIQGLELFKSSWVVNVNVIYLHSKSSHPLWIVYPLFSQVEDDSPNLLFTTLQCSLCHHDRSHRFQLSRAIDSTIIIPGWVESWKEIPFLFRRLEGR